MARAPTRRAKQTFGGFPTPHVRALRGAHPGLLAAAFALSIRAFGLGRLGFVLRVVLAHQPPRPRAHRVRIRAIGRAERGSVRLVEEPGRGVRGVQEHELHLRLQALTHRAGLRPESLRVLGEAVEAQHLQLALHPAHREVGTLGFPVVALHGETMKPFARPRSARWPLDGAPSSGRGGRGGRGRCRTTMPWIPGQASLEDRESRFPSCDAVPTVRCEDLSPEAFRAEFMAKNLPAHDNWPH